VIALPLLWESRSESVSVVVAVTVRPAVYVRVSVVVEVLW
jgi:hypothetical protein